MGTEGKPALALFDIDGTLVRRAGPHHRTALEEAIRRPTGIETTTDGIPLYGMLDPDIIAAMLRRSGAPHGVIRASMPAIVRRAQALYVRSCPVLERRVCPGVRRLLGRLARRGLLLGLVSGNLTRIGWKKVERAGLREYFRFGAFGEMARDRTGLVRMARRRAVEEGWIAAGAAVSLIGDAPADILAARANGVRAIAVATGVVPAEELRRFKPDLVVEDLRALDIGMLL